MNRTHDPMSGRPEAFGGASPAGAGIHLTEKEEKLILLIREMQFGEIQLHIADGQPVRLEEVRRSVKL